MRRKRLSPQSSFFSGVLAGAALLYWLQRFYSSDANVTKARGLTPSMPFFHANLSGGPLSSVHSSQQDNKPLFWTTEELGVFHYRLPGHDSRSSFGVVMHILIKVLTYDATGMKIRGAVLCEQTGALVYLERIKEESRQIWHMPQPEGLGTEWRPCVALIALDGTRHEFAATFFKDRTLPFGLDLELTEGQALNMPSAQLQVDDWPAAFEVSPHTWAEHLKPGSLLQRHKPMPLPGGRKRVVMVQKYFWGRNAIHVAPVVVQSLRYHRRLGVDSFLVYPLAGMMHSLMQHPDALAAIHAGDLRVVEWTSQFPQYRQLFNYTDQTFFATHALLAHHNDDVLLLIVDLDEILVSFRPLLPMQLGELMARMLAQQSRVSHVALARVAVMCFDCHGTPQSPQHAAAGQLPLELALWVNSDLKNMSAHPLLHYKYLPIGDDGKLALFSHIGKSFCDPRKMRTYRVHTGKGMPGFGMKRVCYRECPGSFDVGGLVVPPLLLLHLKSLHGVRGDWRPWDEAHRMLRTEWLWPFSEG